MPHTPCTEMAPTGSSILSLPLDEEHRLDRRRRRRSTPMTAAAHGSTKAHGAVMATRPASMPLAIMPGSGLPVRIQIQNMPTIAPKAAAIAVLAATTRELRRRSPRRSRRR